MNEKSKPPAFLALAGEFPVIDVRSEKEYLQGHIPGSINLPLFNNEERAIVGTIYKNSGREASVLKGLDLAGPKLADFVKRLHKITDRKQLLVHCWRGGMRSESMAWLFEVAGYHVSVLDGGYKAYRRYIREELANPLNLVVLGGNTGSGKTEILTALSAAGEQVLDLEALACHKGSVYGGLGMPDQPTNEQFENDLYQKAGKFSASGRVWIEDESRMIGRVNIPDPLFDQMSRAPMIRIEADRESRIARLISEYSGYGADALKQTTAGIAEKIGGTNIKAIYNALDHGDFYPVVQLVLDYYDKSYEHAVARRPGKEVHVLPLTGNDAAVNAMILLGYLDSIQSQQYMPYGSSLS